MISERRLDSLTALSEVVAVNAAEALADAIAARGQAFWAVSGGRTPQHYLPILARRPIDWTRVVVTLTDERWVDGNHADSNEGLVRRALLATGASGARFMRLKTAHSTPAQALAECEATIAALPWPLDLVLLGMGEDGHIASLFPDDLGWGRAAGRCYPVAAMRDRLARMSLSPAALCDARQIFLAISGAVKERMLRKALMPGSPSEIPARLVLCQEAVPVRVFFVPH